MQIRLQKFLADAGIASRRKSEELITNGCITVNGEIITTLGTKINPNEDIIHYKNKIIKIQTKNVYYLLNKPIGYITSIKDDRDRKTVLDLINVKTRIYPVGRLDYNSSGLLIMTNDGALTYRLTHPKYHISKKYKVKVKGHPKPEIINQLSQGIDLNIYKTSKCHIKKIEQNKNTTTYEIVLYEGKNRQIRRMFEHFNCEVLALKRTAIGSINLANLKTGSYRELTLKEIDYLKSM